MSIARTLYEATGFLPVELFLIVMMFVGGIALLPLIAYMGGIVNAIGGPVGSVLWILGSLGFGDVVLEQQASGEYEIVRGESDQGPANYWSRLGFVPFGIAPVRTAEAYGRAVRKREELDGVGDLSGSKKETTTERAGHGTYFNTRAKGDWFVEVGQYLAAFKDAAGIGAVNTAQAQQLKNSAGDTSGLGGLTMLVGMVGFTLLGVGLGWFIFF